MILGLNERLRIVVSGLGGGTCIVLGLGGSARLRRDRRLSPGRPRLVVVGLGGGTGIVVGLGGGARLRRDRRCVLIDCGSPITGLPQVHADGHRGGGGGDDDDEQGDARRESVAKATERYIQAKLGRAQRSGGRLTGNFKGSINIETEVLAKSESSGPRGRRPTETQRRTSTEILLNRACLKKMSDR